jgi:protein-L-isoaspartate(D-aspartate) O-methyltransferase
MSDRASERARMVEDQLRARGIADARLLAAFAAVPRELFVPEELRGHAYRDCALRIEAGQTISQPYVVALMIEAAGIGPGDRVLEIGAGSGYAAAILAALGARVTAIERHAELAGLAAARLATLRLSAEVIAADGSCGWPAGAPYDAILVPAAASAVPPALHAQLVEGGRLVMPVGEAWEQRLLRLVREADDWREADLGPVRFVPLVAGEAPPANVEPRSKMGS